MHVAKWGNSLAIRIPASVAHVLDLKEGDDVGVSAGNGKTILLTVSASRDEIIERIRAYRGTLPPGFRFDRDEANQRATADPARPAG